MLAAFHCSPVSPDRDVEASYGVGTCIAVQERKRQEPAFWPLGVGGLCFALDLHFSKGGTYRGWSIAFCYKPPRPPTSVALVKVTHTPIKGKRFKPQAALGNKRLFCTLGQAFHSYQPNCCLPIPTLTSDDVVSTTQFHCPGKDFV